MRVVIDTNVFVSGLFFGGIPRTTLNFIEDKAITPCFTVSTFKELKHLLYHNKFSRQKNLLPFPIFDFLNALKERSLFFIEPPEIPEIIKEDRSDNFILVCGICAQASFIISGDEHLLKLKSFQGIPILTPRQFLTNFKRSK